MSKENGTIHEMGDILRDTKGEHASTLSGSLVGMLGGSVVLLAKYDTGKPAGYTQDLHSEINGLQQAKQELMGPTSQIRASQQNINSAITQKRSEIREVRESKPDLSVGLAAETMGTVGGGAILGALFFTAIAARVRVARRNRAAEATA